MTVSSSEEKKKTNSLVFCLEETGDTVIGQNVCALTNTHLKNGFKGMELLQGSHESIQF